MLEKLKEESGSIIGIIVLAVIVAGWGFFIGGIETDHYFIAFLGMLPTLIFVGLGYWFTFAKDDAEQEDNNAEDNE